MQTKCLILLLLVKSIFTQIDIDCNQCIDDFADAGGCDAVEAGDFDLVDIFLAQGCDVCRDDPIFEDNINLKCDTSTVSVDCNQCIDDFAIAGGCDAIAAGDFGSVDIILADSCDICRDDLTFEDNLNSKCDTNINMDVDCNQCIDDFADAGGCDVVAAGDFDLVELYLSEGCEMCEYEENFNTNINSKCVINIDVDCNQCIDDFAITGGCDAVAAGDFGSVDILLADGCDVCRDDPTFDDNINSKCDISTVDCNQCIDDFAIAGGCDAVAAGDFGSVDILLADGCDVCRDDPTFDDNINSKCDISTVDCNQCIDDVTAIGGCDVVADDTELIYQLLSGNCDVCKDDDSFIENLNLKCIALSITTTTTQTPTTTTTQSPSTTTTTTQSPTTTTTQSPSTTTTTTQTPTTTTTQSPTTTTTQTPTTTTTQSPTTTTTQSPTTTTTQSPTTTTTQSPSTTTTTTQSPSTTTTTTQSPSTTTTQDPDNNSDFLVEIFQFVLAFILVVALYLVLEYKKILGD